METEAIHQELMNLVEARNGHFRLESGHHGNLWMDLEPLCVRPRRVQHLATTLARQLSTHDVEAVCGPLVEGSFIALMVALELGVDFFYAERSAAPSNDVLYSVEYRIPTTLRDRVSGRRVAIVNDVTNAGSAVRGTFLDLRACSAQIVAIGTLLVLGSWTSDFAADRGIALESVAFLPNTVWEPSECPLCAAHIPLQDFVH